VALLGNRIHNDRGPGVDLQVCDGVTIERNRFSNYRPDEDDHTGGAAIQVNPGCRGLRFQTNSLMEASIGLLIGAAADSAGGPRDVTVARNYLENRLTTEATAVAIESGGGVRIVNNVIDRYAEPFRIGPGTSGVAIANNLILAPSIAFDLPPAPLAVFDANVFGAAATLPARVGGSRVEAAEWLKAHSSASRVVPGVDLQDGDLGRIQGFSPSGAGRRVDGVPFEGKAPDVGIADK
jgi:hypothetical protein